MKKNTDVSGLISAIILLGVIILGTIGWVMNIFKLFGADAIAGMEVVRAIGILFAPLGAIVGWF